MRQVAKHDQAEFQPATQTDLDKFLTFFQKKNPEFFRKTLKRISKNCKFEYQFLNCQLATHVNAEFQLTHLDKFFRKTLQRISKHSKFEYQFIFANKQRLFMLNFSDLP
jgi:hypothetical protein